MKVSIIIVTYQSARDILSCLQSVSVTSPTIERELILVDAGSDDTTVAVATASSIPHRIITLRNVGFAAAANRGAHHASGDMLFFLNPDARLLPATLGVLLSAFQDPRVGIVGGYLMDTERNAEGWQNIPFPSFPRVLQQHLSPSPSKVLPTSAPFSVPWVSGGGLAIRRSVFEDLHGFRETFFLYFEDVDLCRRARLQGITVLLHPGAQVVHERGRSAGTRARTIAYDRSQRRYFALARPSWEQRAMMILRPWYRLPMSSVVYALLVSVGGLIVSPLFVFVALGCVSVMVITVRSWRLGVMVLLLTLLFGQAVRLPVGDVFLTLTDILLPSVLCGGLITVIRRQRLRSFFRSLTSGWWILAGILPGILLALERLPRAEQMIVLFYAGRLLALLALIPLSRTLGLRFRDVKRVLITIATFLALIGGIQLVLLPSLPAPIDALGTRLFLTFSGGGWDPHHGRLFSTWLDPNFLGGFFVIALALLLAQSTKQTLLSSLYASTRRVFLTPQGAALGAVLLSALLLTQSRTSLVAFLAMCLLFLFCGTSRRVLVPLASATLLVLVFLPSFIGRLTVVPQEDPTVRLRLASLEEAVHHAERFPLFGIGYNAYAIEQRTVGAIRDFSLHSRSGTDNGLLMILVTSGIWGSVLIVGGIVFSLRRLLADTRRGNADALGVLLAWTALLTHTQFVYSLPYIHLLLPLVLLFGSLQVAPKKPSVVRR